METKGVAMNRLLTLAAVLVLAATCAQARQQVFRNGSFEDLDPNDPNNFSLDPNGLNTWRYFSTPTGPTTLDALYGNYSFGIIAGDDSGGFAGAVQGPLLEGNAGPNEHVLLRCMAKHLSTNPISGELPCPGPIAGIKMEFRDASGLETPPAVEDLAFPKNDPNDPNDDDPNDVWVQKTLVVEVPDGVQAARIVLINFDNSETNGPAYMDNVRAELASAPGVNQLSNASFENGTDAEDGITDWDEFASEGSGARYNVFEIPAQDGFAVVKFSGITSGITQSFPANPGDTITLTGYFRSNGADPFIDVDAQVGLKVEWEVASAVPAQVDICENGQTGSAVNNIVTVNTPTDEWVPLTIDFTFGPDEAAGIVGTIIIGWNDFNGTIFFDGFELVFADRFDGSDMDADDDADMTEVAALQTVVTGDGGGLVYPGLVFDHDDDEDVDASDALYTVDSGRITGPN